MFRSPFVGNGQNRQLYIETGSRLAVARGWRMRRVGRDCWRVGFLLGYTKMF